MESMGYSRQFIDMLKTLYSTCDMQIMNGEDVCGTITCTNSIRQGCPLSMHLFVIFLEPLLAKLKQNLRGLNVGMENFKLRAFVDDLTVVATNDDNLNKLGACLEGFCAAFGASINKAKTTAVGLGE